MHSSSGAPDASNQNQLEVLLSNYVTSFSGHHATDKIEFAFKKRLEKIDWRKIAAADVDVIVRTLDFDILQENIANIAFCDIEQELDMQCADPSYVKLFQLAQLTIEYLLHSQDYLFSKLQETQSVLTAVTEELSKVRSQAETCQKELESVKVESHKRKKIIATQQLVLQNGKEAYNRCPFCTKAFINQSFLDAHIIKRHNGSSHIKLVHSTQVAPMTVASASLSVPPAANSTESDELDSIKQRLHQTECRLVKEIEARNEVEAKLQEMAASVERRLRKEMTSFQQNLHVEHQKELERYSRELRETSEKLRVADAALQKKIDLPLDKFELMQWHRQREDCAILNEELQAEKAALTEKKAELSKQVESATVDKASVESLSDVSQKCQQSRQLYSQAERHAQMPDHQKSRKRSRQPTDLKQRMLTNEGTKMTSPSVSNQQLTAVKQVFSDDIDSEDDSNTFGTRTLPTYDGSLSMTDDDREEKQRRELVKNPELVKSARQRALVELEAELEKRGIGPDVCSINDDLYGTLVGSLKTERTRLAKDIKNFYDIRNQLMNSVDIHAKDKVVSINANAITTPHSARSFGPPVSAPSTNPVQRAANINNAEALVRPTYNGSTAALSNTQQSATTINSMTFTGTSISQSDSYFSDTESVTDNLSARKPQQKLTASQQPPLKTAQGEDPSDWDENSNSELEDVLSPSSPGSAGALPTKAVSSSKSPCVTRNYENDVSLRSVSSVEEAAAVPVILRYPQAQPRGIIRSSGEPSTSVWSSLTKGKRPGSSVTFSDELKSIDDDVDG